MRVATTLAVRLATRMAVRLAMTLAVRVATTLAVRAATTLAMTVTPHRTPLYPPLTFARDNTGPEQAKVVAPMPSRILIAEDDELQGSLLQAAVARRGYQVDMVADGLEAVRRLRSGDYDVALLDYSLPELDGLAAARLTQDLLADDRRPRLIAITASTELLQERDNRAGGPSSFDMIVSKASGIPAMLTAIENALPQVARRDPDGAELESPPKPLPLQQMRASCLAALPSLLMALVFAVGFYWALLCLGQTRTVQAAAKHTVAVGQDAASLVGAVHEAEMSQRDYLLDRTAVSKDVFDAAAEAVDRKLSEPSTLNPSARLDDSGASPQQALAEARLQQLGLEAQARPTRLEPGQDADPPRQDGRDTRTALRQWADRLVSQSQGLLLSSLAVLRHNLYPVLFVLGCGSLYALANAFRAMARKWQALTTRG